MKKDKKFKPGILIIGLFFAILYFSIQSGGINLSINNQPIGKNSIIPALSDVPSFLYEWNRTWDGGHDDCGYGVAVDSSDNIYLVGTGGNFGNPEIILVKYNRKGEQQWNRTWGGINSDYGYGVAVDSSNNIYLAGTTLSFGAGVFDMVLIKYDKNGMLQWYHTWGGADWDGGEGVAVDSLSNVYLVGYKTSPETGYSDMVLIKYDKNGILQWYRTWGGAYDDRGDGVAVDSSNNIYVTGYTRSFGVGSANMVLVKYDKSGTQQWYHTWGGADSDISYGVAVDSSNNIYLAGTTLSFGAGGRDIVLVKYENSGVLQWNQTWGGGVDDGGNGVAVDSLDNVYVVGYTRSFGAGYTDIALVKYDSSGVIQWNFTRGGRSYDGGNGIAVDLSGNIYLVGYTTNLEIGNDDMVLIKYCNVEHVEHPPSDEGIMIIIVVVSIVSIAGVGIVIIYFIRKRRKIVE
jgi:uncharacterized delta-60 repeat protein